MPNLAHPSSKTDSSALVTGGTGFLGRRLVARLLAQGRTVTALARTPAPDLAARGVRFIRAALDDAPAVAAACAGVETVFHVAAKVGVWGRHEEFFRANVLGTRALLEGCRKHGVRRLVYTSTPSVVYNGGDLAGVDESLPLTKSCPSAYPLTKAIAEREVLSANSEQLRTIALRPHLIWGPGDPHLVPRLLARARAGRLRIIGDGRNRVDLVHVENAVDAHLLAESVLDVCHLLDDKRDSVALSAGADAGKGGSRCHLIDDKTPERRRADGRAFFITNGEPVVLWDWINELLCAFGEQPVTKKIPLGAAMAAGAASEFAWWAFRLPGEPPMTRFVAAELARDHWFDISAARRDLGYAPRVTMSEGLAELAAAPRRTAGF